MELGIGWGKFFFLFFRRVSRFLCSTARVLNLVFRDEILYHAKIHPEQYSNSLSDDQIRQLHYSIHYVCATSVDLLADSDLFPEDWLFKHRWGKGKKNKPSVLPNGEKITFLTVAGRTSAIVPSVQKKTGPVAKDVSAEDANGSTQDTTPKRKRAVAPKQETDSGAEEEEVPTKKPAPKKQKSVGDGKAAKAAPASTGTRRSTRIRK